MSVPALRIVEGSSMDKSKALSAALSQIERQFGKGSVMKLGKNDRSMDIETISSGSLGLDIALGVGGLPRVFRPWQVRPGIRLGGGHGEEQPFICPQTGVSGCFGRSGRFDQVML